MTVHARQLARTCRERMAARDGDQPDQDQPDQPPTTPALDETRPMSREEALSA